MGEDEGPLGAVVGWIVLGPMEAVCVTDAPTEADARSRYPNGDVLAVEAVYTYTELRAPVVCAVCGAEFGRGPF